MTLRRLPPLVSESDRHWAAHLQSDTLCAQLREHTLMLRAWGWAGSEWEHFIDSKGGITSERQEEPSKS